MSRSIQEIEYLRKENKIQSARLEVFDSMMQLFNAKPSREEMGMMHPDVLMELKREFDKPPINKNKIGNENA